MGIFSTSFVVLQTSGQYEAALEHVSKSCNILVALRGDQEHSTLNSLGLMAVALKSRGKYEEVEGINRRALAGREKVPGLDHPDTLSSANNLASVLQPRGKYEEAEGMYRRAVAGREKVLEVDHHNTLTSVYCVAYLRSRPTRIFNRLWVSTNVPLQATIGPWCTSSYHGGL